MNETVYGVLPHQEIHALLGNDKPCKNVILGADPKHVKSASYDLRLGTTYYLYKEQNIISDASIRISDMKKKESGVIIIPPHQAIYVSIEETLDLPEDLVGHLSLKLDLTLKGLMMSAQSQIDAGYKGNIFALLFNLSANDIALKVGSEILRLELVRMQAVSKRPYQGDIKGKPLKNVLTEHVNSSNAQLKADIDKRVERVNAKIRNYGIIGLVVAFLGVIAPSVFTYFGPTNINENSIIAMKQQLIELNKSLKDVELKNEGNKTKLDSLEGKLSFGNMGHSLQVAMMAKMYDEMRTTLSINSVSLVEVQSEIAKIRKENEMLIAQSNSLVSKEQYSSKYEDLQRRIQQNRNEIEMFEKLVKPILLK
ncbi:MULTISPECIES: dCTP deaminase domain-containing protein [unclassified Pseudoalteromonas]|uniref:dCTP deaminase domain-containing protein n=1 Tax=unclassified Pseudoalteromonas TaxID=194690 RepID=UPI001F29A8E9|nr:MULTISPECIES: hypothetical protein [unclassified Pseudoalteromonas]MCF2828782.1 hypothetical protein [Pseudoalteromonas sp. OF5H-5]MCF2832280.1 hypothetical protein [Pseudoalteromonas sp. DL2-H6]MCF2925046.1 hypothetical protein [Pseudoalteromonas sp. DL2-H1]